MAVHAKRQVFYKKGLPAQRTLHQWHKLGLKFMPDLVKRPTQRLRMFGAQHLGIGVVVEH